MGLSLEETIWCPLGTGNYGHLVIDHSAMLLRQVRSLYKYSGQGFEASHKLHRNLYSKATNHDASAPGQSCKFSLEIKSQFQSFYCMMSCCPPTYLTLDDPLLNNTMYWWATLNTTYLLLYSGSNSNPLVFKNAVVITIFFS